jgi:hypothetical protein
VPLPAVVQRRVDDEATAWAHAFPDPLVADPELRTAAHRFADATAPVLLDVAPTRSAPTRALAGTALVLAILAVLGLVLPLAAVPLLVVAAVLCLGVAWGVAAAIPAPPPLDELRSALRAAAYRGVLPRRSSRRAAEPAWRTVPEGIPSTHTGSVALPPAARGRATYEAAVHLVGRDTSRVIDL